MQKLLIFYYRNIVVRTKHERMKEWLHNRITSISSRSCITQL